MMYTLNPDLFNVIINKSNDDKVKWFCNILGELERFNNNSQPYESYFDVPRIEDELVTMLPEEELGDIVIALENKLKTIITEGLHRNGITLNPEITNRVILSILEEYNNLIELEKWMSEPIINFIDSLETSNYNTREYILALCLTENSSISTQEVFENIEEVGDKVLPFIKNTVLSNDIEDGELDELLVIDTLNRINHFFNLTPELTRTKVMRASFYKHLFNKELHDYIPYMVGKEDDSFTTLANEVIAGIILLKDSQMLKPEDVKDLLIRENIVGALNINNVIEPEAKIAEIFKYYRR